MKDLLKEAIADAKAVRETALANAKLALEEAFTPRLQSMLSAKLAEELSDDEEEMTEMETEEYADYKVKKSMRKLQKKQKCLTLKLQKKQKMMT